MCLEIPKVNARRKRERKEGAGGEICLGGRSRKPQIALEHLRCRTGANENQPNLIQGAQPYNRDDSDLSKALS